MNTAYTIASGPESATSDIKLLAALTAMGVPLGNPPCLPMVDRHGREKWEFYLGDATLDGKHTTRQLIKFWAMGDEFERSQPEHPFAYICAAIRNHTSLVEAIHGIRPLAQIRKRDSVALIHVDAPDKIQNLILGGLR